jgi:MOSC domain-containing protein YiiM
MIETMSSARPAAPPAPSWRGKVLRLFTAPVAGAEMEERTEVRCIEGVGLDGDRYATGLGHYSRWPHADRQATLIAQEVLAAVAEETGIVLLPEETRRNIVVQGVPLNELVGVTFRVGDVLLVGGRLNVPCRYLERLIDKSVFGPLTGRSGLNCRIVAGGIVRPGAEARPADG